MDYIIGADTDIGISKDTNQDSLVAKVVNTDFGKVAMVILCDGMGGLSKGELASANVVRAFSDWFEKVLPTMMTNEFKPNLVKSSWDSLIQYQNTLLFKYGKNNYAQLGTTLVGAIMFEGQYFAVNVGDSRMYKLSDTITQVTNDQSLVYRDVLQGKITDEEAEHDPRRNVLLQCIGATEKVSPDYYEGEIKTGEALLLCCDGFRHETKKEEMFTYLNPVECNDKNTFTRNIRQLIQLNIDRNETDNITALVIKAV